MTSSLLSRKARPARRGRLTRTTATTTMAAALALSASGLALPSAQATDSSPAPDQATHDAVSPRGLVTGDPVTISTGTVPITDHPGLLRTADGVLHMSYTRVTGPGHVQAAHAAISPAGQVLRRTDITGPWMFLSASSIVPAPGGMRVVLSGYDGLDGAYSKGGVYSALGDGAGTWSVPTERLNKFHGDSTDAVALADGTPLTAVLHWSGLFLHGGTFTQDNTGAPHHQQLGAAGGYSINLERLGDEVYAAWHVLGNAGTPGTYVQRVHPTLGAVVPAPGSAGSTDAVGSSNRSALAVSTTGHLYSAYCAGQEWAECKNIALWNVSTGHVTHIPASGGFTRAITLSPAPDGRMWVTWRSGSAELTGVRTNRTGKAVGAPTVRRMGDDFSFPHSAAESSLGFADVVLTLGDRHVLARLLPSLTVAASPRRLRAGRPQVVRFLVRDAGDAVRGARVRAGGRSCRTDGSGKCSIRLMVNRPGRVSARVVSGNYAPALVRLRVRR